MDRYREAVKKESRRPSYAAVVRNIAAEKEGYATFFHGLSHTAARDAGFTVTYRVLAPYLKEEFKPDFRGGISQLSQWGHGRACWSLLHTSF